MRTTNTENTAAVLMPLNSVSTAQNNPSKSVVIKIGSFGIGTVLTSVNTTANCLIMIQLGAEGGCSLSTAYQSLFRNVCSGALLVCGVELGNALGKHDDNTASEVVVTSYALTGILTLGSSIAYGATYFIFPKVFAPTTAEAASTYLLWSGLGTWPSLALITTGQMAFQCGDWKSPLVSTIVYRLPAAGLSYLLANTEQMGVKGIGIGNLIAPWIAYIGMELWLIRNEFSHIKQVKFSRAIVLKHLKAMASRGVQMSSQKLTEWLNLLLITIILARMDDKNLAIINPSVQLMNFFNLFSQGVGQGGNMILAKDHATMKHLIEQYKQQSDEQLLEQIKTLQKSIVATSIKSYAVGILINVICAITLFAAKKQISNWFLSSNTTESMHDVAETTLWINGLGLVADAMRIISGCILNTWDRILFPNIVSFVLMSVIGIPLNFLIAMKKDNDYAVASMFVLRTVTIFLAALINTYMLYQCIMRDKNEINALLQQADNTSTSHEVNTIGDDEENAPIPPSASAAAAEEESIPETPVISNNDLVTESLISNNNLIAESSAASSSQAAAADSTTQNVTQQNSGYFDGLYHFFGYGQSESKTQPRSSSAEACTTKNLWSSVSWFFSYGKQDNAALQEALIAENNAH